MELSSVSYVLLGTLSFRPLTGYEIKSLLDQSTRFFWAISYSQIYPELKRLDEAGLVASRDTTEGGRKRIEYRITDAGRQALKSWLAQSPRTFEMRDEGLLKLFFAGAGDPEDAITVLRAMETRHREMVQRLRDLEQAAGCLEPGNPYPEIVRRSGAEFFELFAEWCAKTQRELQDAMGGDGTTPQATDPNERTPDV
jgi:DNA-binding PadR family transcriptional regulator